MRRFLLDLLAGQAIAGIRNGVLLLLLGSHLGFKIDACLLSGGLRAPGFLHRALFGLALRARFDFQARTNLRFAFGLGSRVRLGLLAGSGQRGFKCRIVLRRGWRIRRRRCAGALDLAFRCGAAILRGFEAGGRTEIDLFRWRRRFFRCGEIEIVVVAEAGHRHFLLDFEHFDEAVLLQSSQRFFQRRHRIIRLVRECRDIRLSVDGLQHLHQIAR